MGEESAGRLQKQLVEGHARFEEARKEWANQAGHMSKGLDVRNRVIVALIVMLVIAAVT